MDVLAVGASCPEELLTLAESSERFSDLFTLTKPLSFRDLCCINLVKGKCGIEQAVVKAYNKQRLSAAEREQVNLEIEIHSQLGHDSVLQLYLALEDAVTIYLVLEYAEGGCLNDCMPVMDECLLRDQVAAPLLCALHHMHELGMVHRDLKPENVLYKEGNVKLGDFGLSVYSDLDGSRQTDQTPLKNAGGTPLYTAPEVLNALFNNKRIAGVTGPKVDIWALGILILEVFMGFHPFSSCPGNVLFTIANQTEISVPEELSIECRDWLRKALHKDPAKRATAQELMQHSWLLSSDAALQRSSSCPKSASACSLESASSATSVRSSLLICIDQQCWEY